MATTPAFAGCNSGNTGSSVILTGAPCQASATGDFATAVGTSASADATQATAFGDHAVVQGSFGTAVGAAASANLGNAAAFGNHAVAGGSFSTAIGTSASANGANATALGNSASTAFTGSMAIGEEAKASGEAAIAIGTDSQAAASGTAIGLSTNAATGGVAVGLAAAAKGIYATAIGAGSGNSAAATGDYGIAIGSGDSTGNNIGAQAQALRSIAVGQNSVSGGSDAMALGSSAQATKKGAVAIGSDSVGNVANAVSVGHRNHERRIINVADAVDKTDAATLGQVKALIRKAATAAAATPNPRPVAAIGIVALERPALAVRKASTSQPLSSAAGTGSSRGSNEQVADARSSSPAVARAREDQAPEPSTIVGWANVNRDGTPAKVRNIMGNARHGIGSYEIAFTQPSVQSCTYHATLNGMGFVSVSAGPLPNSVTVETHNHYGAPADAAFYVMVVC